LLCRRTRPSISRPTISAGLDYDDNRRLDPVNPKTVTTQRYFPALLFGIRTPAVDTRGIARAEIIQADVTSSIAPTGSCA
jgi:hypothetical protein